MIKLNEILKHKYGKTHKIWKNKKTGEELTITFIDPLDDLAYYLDNEKEKTMSFKELDKLYKKDIKEEKIANIKQDVKIEVVIDKSIHAKERQKRDPNFFISDEDIIKMVENATPRIAQLMILDVIDIKNFVHIYNHINDINIIGYLKRTENEKIKFIVVTVMKKKNFKVKSERGKKITTINI